MNKITNYSTYRTSKHTKYYKKVSEGKRMKKRNEETSMAEKRISGFLVIGTRELD